MNEEKNNMKSGWGGARKGAGRKGRGGKLIAFRAPKEILEIIEAQENKSEFIKQCIEASITAENIAKNLENNYDCEIHELKPVMVNAFDARVAAGSPISPGDIVFEQEDARIWLSPHSNAVFTVRVKGESMIEAGILSGSHVFIDPTDKNPDKDTAALCELNGELTVKYFEKDEDGGWMYPANPLFEPIRVNASDQFRILGVVTSVVQSPKKRNR